MQYRYPARVRAIGLTLLLPLAALGAMGCTDPAVPPLLAALSPNPVVPLAASQNLDFLGSNMDPGVYFMLDTGTRKIPLEPASVPGHWTFRCVFGFHYIYTFDSLADFLASVGSPSELSIQAFNVGSNLAAEGGTGDDPSSRPVIWEIDY